MNGRLQSRQKAGLTWDFRSVIPPALGLSSEQRYPPKEGSEVTASTLSSVQQWPKELWEGRQAESVLPDQRVEEAQDGADQPELR